ncbi:MAG: hypothetical protein J5I98_03985 [Phaeodactylibacter sp.]|nr:hypothetical protein [Phaeodactylibacter sp.]
MKTPLLYLAIPALVFAGCASGGEEGKHATPDAFFDLKGYMESEIQRLSETQPEVLKRIAIDGRGEEKTFDSLDYEKELDIFSRSDINKVAWLDKYRVDSVYQGGQLARLTYTSKDKDLKTHLLEVRFSDGQVTQVHVQNKTESIVADVGQEIWYQPAKGYRLASRQSTALTEEKEVEVEVEFLE